MSILTRLAPLTGVLAIGAIVASLASDSLPDSTSDDMTLATYVAAHGAAGWFAMATGIAIGGALLLVFTAVVDARLAEAGVGPITRGVAQTPGTAWGTLVLLGGALEGVVPIKLIFYSPGAPSAALYPYLNAMSYSVLVSVCAYAAALLTVALSVAALRTGVLPRWLAVVGFPAALLMLANILLPMSMITIYMIITCITLTVRVVPSPSATALDGSPRSTVTVQDAAPIG